MTAIHSKSCGTSEPRGTEDGEKRFDRAIETGLALLLIFATAALGAVQAWSEMIFIAGAGMLALRLAIKLLRRAHCEFVWSWTYLPLGLFAMITALQLVRLPQWVVAIISPRTIELRRSLSSVMPAAAEPGPLTISFYPEGTWHDLCLMGAISALYVVVLNVIRRPDQIRRVLKLITLIGAGTALVAMAHLGLRADRIYGLVGQFHGAWLTAPFVNRNHFGQMMNLCLGAGAALLLCGSQSAAQVRGRQTPREGKKLRESPANLWLFRAAVALMALGVVLSLSRGAMISMLLAGSVMGLAMWRRGMGGRMWLVAPLAGVAGLVAVWFGCDTVIARFANLPSQGLAGRLQIARDVLAAAREFPVLGTGMGSFATVYPMFDSSLNPYLAAHADNEYAQVLFEAGIAGILVVGTFLVLMARNCRRCFKTANAPVAIGLGFGLGAVVLQSFSDFGQHVPAIAAIAAIFCAILTALSEQSAVERGIQTRVAAPKSIRRILISRAMATGIVALLLAAIAASVWSRARAEWKWSSARAIQARLEKQDWQGQDDDYTRVLIAAGRAAELCPGDIHYRYELNFLRWKSIARQRDDRTGQILLTGQQVQWARRIADELLDSAKACPTFGPVYSLAGQIHKNVLGNQPLGEVLIRSGYRLAPTDPAASFETALLDARDGNWDAAFGKFRRAASLDASFLARGVASLAGGLRRPDLAMQLAGDDLDAVREIAEVVGPEDASPAAGQVRQKIAALVEARANAPQAPAGALVEAARLAVSQGKVAAALRYYQRALERDSVSAQLHLEMADFLNRNGRADQALAEAHIARQLGSGTADRFILELRLRPSTSAPTTAP